MYALMGRIENSSLALGELKMIASVSHNRRTPKALVGLRVILATQTKPGLARISGEQGGGVVHGACHHAEFILEESSHGQERALKFHSLV